MTNDISDTNPEDAVRCFALSKKDSYVMSASGGKISLFNMMTFKVKTKLKGHQKGITGLAFSHVLNVLVSSGSDSHKCDDGDEDDGGKTAISPSNEHKRLVVLVSKSELESHNKAKYSVEGGLDLIMIKAISPIISGKGSGPLIKASLQKTKIEEAVVKLWAPVWCRPKALRCLSQLRRGSESWRCLAPRKSVFLRQERRRVCLGASCFETGYARFSGSRRAVPSPPSCQARSCVNTWKLGPCTFGKEAKAGIEGLGLGLFREGGLPLPSCRQGIHELGIRLSQPLPFGRGGLGAFVRPWWVCTASARLSFQGGVEFAIDSGEVGLSSLCHWGGLARSWSRSGTGCRSFGKVLAVSTISAELGFGSWAIRLLRQVPGQVLAILVWARGLGEQLC
ncbi:unnamed protein product [Prunus armeniaca]